MRISKLSVALPCAGLVLTALPVAAAEDLTIVFKDGKGALQTQYFTSTKMRHNMGDRDSIMDMATGTMTSIDNKKKEYSQITVEQLEAVMKQNEAQMKQAQAQMEQAMAKVPPEMRQKMEQMMGGVTEAITVTRGATRKVAGYDTQQYTIAMGASMKTDMWTTTALQLPFDPTQFRKMSGFSGPAMGGPMMKNAAKLAEKMKEVQGFALASTTMVAFMGKSSTTSREAVEVKQGAIDPSVFALPAGYKKVDAPLMKSKAPHN